MTQDKIQAHSQGAPQTPPTRSTEETSTGQVESATPKKKPLDFSKLDLRVEKVDERISPSETNVFDK